jgi:hypothetical protein
MHLDVLISLFQPQADAYCFSVNEAKQGNILLFQKKPQRKEDSVSSFQVFLELFVLVPGYRPNRKLHLFVSKVLHLQVEFVAILHLDQVCTKSGNVTRLHLTLCK